MKKVLLILAAVISLAAPSLQADTPIWYDVLTNYPGGGITTNSGGLWYAHPPGALTPADLLVVTNTYTSGAAVNGKRLRVNGLNNQYGMRLFDAATTNSILSGVVYASFVANANFVPGAGQGTYFGCFANVSPNNPPDGTSATNGFDFRGRVFQIGTTNAYPFTTTVAGTYRFGVANAAGDPAQGGGPSILNVPIDLVRNVDYQVVLKYDIDNAEAQIWINPASESDTPNWSGKTSDSGAAASGLAGFLWRQRTGGGTVDVRDLAVGLTFASVMTNSCGAVLVATNYNTVSTYSGNPALLEAFATSIGGGPLSYQWYKLSGGTSNLISGATGQTYLVPQVSSADVANYCCVIANSCGSSASTTTNFAIAVNATLTPPTFSTKMAATLSASVGGKLNLTNAAFGTGPLSYQWDYNGTPLTDGTSVTGQPTDLSVVSGAQSPILTVSGLSTNDSGNYRVTVTSAAGGLPFTTTNTTCALTVSPAKAVSIAYIRSLEDPSTWQVTDTTGIYTVSNAVVTIYTNVTSGTTASYYIQDATAGVNLFITGDASFRPQMGDIVNVSGTLSSFRNVIELLVDSSNPYQFYNIVGHTNVLPAPYVFPLSLTNNPGVMETNIEGRICMLTNVYFNGSLTTASGNGSLYVTNAGGGPAFQIFFPGGTDLDVRSKTIPNRFAYTITGVMAQFLSGAYNNATYELYVTRIGDIVTTPPPQPQVSFTKSGNNLVLNWTAVPYLPGNPGDPGYAPGAYAYSVWSASNVEGPYTPLATGMAFNTIAGSYTVTNAFSGSAQYYRVSSP